jgi:ATP-binding cassette, subfamily B, bacterial
MARERKQTLRRLKSAIKLALPYVRPEWKLVALSLGSVLAASGIALLRPWPLKILIDDVLKLEPGTQPDWPDVQTLVFGVALAVLGIAVLQGLFSYTQTYWLSAAGERIAARVRSAVFSQLRRLPLTYHDRQRTGDLVTRVTSDVSKAQELVLDDLLVVALARSVQVGGMIIVMLVIDWPVGLVAALTIPLTSMTSAFFRRRLRAKAAVARNREGSIASMTQETMSSIRTVKALGRHHHLTRQFDDASDDMMAAGIASARLEGRFGWALTVMSAVMLALVIVFGSYRVVAGAMSIGTLVVFIQYMRDLQSPLLGLSRFQGKLAKASVRAERILEVLNEPVAVHDSPSAVPAPALSGHIRLESVSFSYKPGAPVLSDVSLTLRPGEVVAVVGPSGIGKSTLASLLLRLYDPESGTIYVDDTDLRTLTVDSYIAQTAVVLQETLLFHTTVAENIAYGRSGATEEQIVAAAVLADADGFIQTLPQGYDTLVGERGATLSGGQRQRIAIARALVRDAPILVLDEPTTGLDAAAEKSVLDALDTLIRGRTTLMITHNESTVRRADRVLRIEGGRLREHTHARQQASTNAP